MLIASVAVPLLLFTAAAAYDYARTLNQAERLVRAAVDPLREHALRLLETDDLLLREVDRRIQGKNWSEIRAAQAALSQDLRTMAVGLPEVSDIAIIDARGEAVVTIAPDPDHRASAAGREYWLAQRDADRGMFVSRAYVGQLSHRLNFGISRRRSTADGSFDGVIHIAIDVGYFTRLWAQSLREQPGAAIALFRSDGEILARFPGAANQVLPRLTAPSSTVMARLSAGLHAGVFSGRSPIDGVRRISAVSDIGATPLLIAYAVAISSVLAPWRQDMLGLLCLCGAAAVALVLVVAAAMRQEQTLAAEQARRRAVEQAAREARRLELLGQLAAGVAHDFANFVQVVLAAAALLDRAAQDPARVRLLVRTLGDAASQGVSLTRRLLDFARPDGAGETPSGGTAEPARAAPGACELLGKTLGPAYQLRCELAEGLPERVRGEQADLEAVLINLVINARDAMPAGGLIRVLAAPERSPAGLAPGLYVRFAVEDHGIGMTPEVLSRATEPFFTTKPRGRGTGLGLAGARGFAERAGGQLRIDSVLGKGTTVTVLLPAVEADRAGTLPQTPPNLARDFA